MRRAGVEPALPEAGGLQPLELANAQPTQKLDAVDNGLPLALVLIRFDTLSALDGI